MHNIPLFDTHCDTITVCENEGRLLREHAEGHLDLVRLKEYTKSAQFFAMYQMLTDCPADGMLAKTKRIAARFASEIAKNSDIVTQCRTAADIKKANAEGKIAAILSCEGSELLNCDVNSLDWAHEVGIKSINLSWNHSNFLTGSNLHETTRGLNDLGKAFVKRAQELGILIDVSHVSDPGFWDLMEITTKPVLASHSNSRVICNHTRNITDDMFKAIMQTGGVVGLNFWVAFIADKDEPTMDDIVRHVDHFMELGGEKHVGIGADLDGCARLAGGMRGVQDMPMLWEALSKRGYSDALLEDIFYNNFLAMMERNDA